MRRSVMIGLAGALAAGCGVSKQVVEQQQVQLEQLQREVAAGEEALAASRAETAAAREEAQVCREELSAAAERAEECAAARQRAEQGLEGMTGLQREVAGARTAAAEAEGLLQREAQLRGQLQDELDQRSVEIERLKGQLTVRVMDRVLFDSGSAEISGVGAAVLARLGPVLAEGPGLIRVEGHTDDLPVGPSLKALYFSNWELAAARAAAVVRYLQFGQGIDPARLEAVGLGGYRPLGSNDTSSARQRNRRVEIVLVPKR